MAAVKAREIAFAKTMADRDLAAFGSFVAEDAVFMGPAPLHGRKAVVDGWKPFFEGPAPFSWAPERVEVTLVRHARDQQRPGLRPRGQPRVDLHLDLAPRQGRRVAGGARHRLPTLPLTRADGRLSGAMDRNVAVNEHVRVCRDCGEEYRPEIVRCADCGGELEDRYPGDEPRPTGGAGRGRPTPSSSAIACCSRPRGPPISCRWRSGCARRRSSVGSRSSRAPRKARRRATRSSSPTAHAKAALAAVTDLVAPHEDAADVHAVETRFDPERGYVQCPACGTAPPPGAVECPECGLGLGGGEAAEEPHE